MKKSLLTLALLAITLGVSAQTTTVYKEGTNTITETVLAQAPAAVPIAKAHAVDKADEWKGPLGYPGNMWGTTVYAADAPAGYLKYRIEGVVEQGVDWFMFGPDKNWKFNTYVAAEYVINSESNGVSPVIGLKASRAFTDGNLDLGVRYKYGNTYLSPTGAFNPGGTKKVGRVEIYATYWFGWNLK